MENPAKKCAVNVKYFQKIKIFKNAGDKIIKGRLAKKSGYYSANSACFLFKFYHPFVMMNFS